MGYVLRGPPLNDVHLDIVLRDEIISRVAIVPDLYDLHIRHGFDFDISQLKDVPEERRQSRFFLLQGVQLTLLRPATI